MCSYCGCQAITVIGRFMAEHDDIVNALTRLRSSCAAQDRDGVADAVTVMEQLLQPHTHAEEVGLFAVMRTDGEFTEHIDRLCAEHTDLDALLLRLRQGEYGEFATFEHALRAHIDHEDNGLFPAAAIALSGPDWEQVDALTPLGLRG